MAEQVPESAQLSATVGDAANVLLLVPSFQAGARAVCLGMLAGEVPDETTVVGVTYTQSPKDWMTDWLDHTGVAPADGVLVCVGEGAGGEDGPATVNGVDVAYVNTASNLTALGVRLSDVLTTDTPGEVRLCFDSLTVLLQYATTDQTFRFLHALTSQVRGADGVAHFHLDPTAHDEQALATLKSLFDAVVTLEDGDWTVKTR